jgi:hypothetical protein
MRSRGVSLVDKRRGKECRDFGRSRLLGFG